MMYGPWVLTVSSTILGTCFVAREPGKTTILIHLNEVHGAIQTTGQFRSVNIEGELLVKELEHLVLRIRCHEVQPRANVLAVLSTCHKLQRQCISRGSDTICARIVSTIKSTVGGAGFAIRAISRVPGVAIVAVVGALGRMQPAPVGIEGDLGRQGSTRSTSRAGLDGQRRVSLSGQCANLLSRHAHCEKGGKKTGLREHGDLLKPIPKD